MNLIRRMWRHLIGIALIAVAILLTPVPTFAAAVTPVTTDSNSLARVTLSAVTVQLLVSTVIPLITGILTKAPSKIKGLVTIVLNVVAAVITTATMADGTAIISEQTLLTAMLGVIVSLAAYAKAWKPLGLTSSIVNVNGVTVEGKLANVGVK